jgi:hypothetical protein
MYISHTKKILAMFVSFEQAEGHETMPHVAGQWFPQANDIDRYELYCASMLALLKPWHNIIEIKNPSDSFSTTFDDFVVHAPETIAQILTNVQYFHDCSDTALSYREKELPCSFATMDMGERLDDDADEIL